MVDQELLTILDANAMQEGRHRQLITFLDFATDPHATEVSVDEFAIRLFEVLRYQPSPKVDHSTRAAQRCRRR